MENSIIEAVLIESGSLFSFQQPCSDVYFADVANKIQENVQAGGRFICMECTGTNIMKKQTSDIFSPSNFFILSFLQVGSHILDLYII